MSDGNSEFQRSSRAQQNTSFERQDWNLASEKKLYPLQVHCNVSEIREWYFLLITKMGI